MEHDRHGARQPERFNPDRASGLNDRARFDYLPPRELLPLLNIPPQGVLVDFGAGTGLYAIEIAALRPDVRVVGVDEQKKMLEFFAQNYSRHPLKNLSSYWSKEEGYRQLRGTVDRILALNVLHELGDGAMEEIKSLLKPLGQVLFVDWSSAVERPAGPPRDHVYSPEEGTVRVQNFGFSVFKKQNFSYHYALLCGVKN